MPNLQHDPQNPTDLLDRPIAVGDIVAWGTTYGRSPALCVGRLEKIRFVTRHGKGYGPAQECPQAQAEDYTLRVRPIKSTGLVSATDKLGDNSWPSAQDILADPDRYEIKVKTIKLVKNIVKLEPYDALA